LPFDAPDADGEGEDATSPPVGVGGRATAGGTAERRAALRAKRERFIAAHVAAAPPLSVEALECIALLLGGPVRHDQTDNGRHHAA
jgi:hypothetical protein